MKLKEIFESIPAHYKDVEITGLSSDSRKVLPGNLFIAKKGFKANGAHFIAEAVEAGAAALLTDLYDPFFAHIPQIVDSDLSSLERKIAEIFYGYALECLIGITGTNGKTTTSYLIAHLLQKVGRPTGLIGTIQWSTGSHIYPPSNTTPDLLQNFKLFSEMTLSGVNTCVMEVSSHALDQGRVREIPFDIAVFTNLTQDHLDYHQTIDAYAKAKTKLFTALKKGGRGIFNADCSFSAQMMAACKEKCLTYGITSPCDLKAENILFTIEGIAFNLIYQEEIVHVTSPLIGRHNVYNLLGAAAVGICLNIPLVTICDAFKTLYYIPGRLEPVANKRGLHVFVDFAHTEDGLRNVLQTLAQVKQGRLITVFGCGGDRDKTKRPLMGAVAQQFSDQIVITSDNPRMESPEEIIRAILKGIEHPEKATIIVDRKAAIAHAIGIAKPNDILLIAGKGHENRQIFASSSIPFDDREVASHYLS